MVSNKLKRSLSLLLAVSMMGYSVAMASKIDIAETNKTIEETERKINNLNDSELKNHLSESIKIIKGKLKDLESEEETDKTIADKVADIIKKLPELEDVKIENKQEVEDARKEYTNLTDNQKKLISKHLEEKLVDLEAKIKQLEEDKLIKVLKSEDIFGLTDVSNLNFMVKSLMNESGTAQKLATLEEVNTHFNNSYTTKGGYKLEAEILDNELVFRTYMTEELFNEIKEKDGADKTAPYRVTVLKGTNKKEDKIFKIAYGQDKIELEEEKNKKDKEQAKEKLDEVLSKSKDYEYTPKYDYKYSGMEILENGVNVEYKNIKAENTKVVMDDLARYLGAMYRVDNGESVKSIIYKDAKYIWDGNLKGSNWKNENSTLIKEITNDFKINNDLREISLKLVGDLEVEKEIQIKGKLIIDATPIEPAVKVLKVKNIFGIKSADSIRFRVKSIIEPGSKEGTTVQKVATLSEVNDHFNNNYNVKNGYKLEVEVTEENITFRTYMSSDLFDEIKGKDGADKALPYKITVLKDSNKENKIGKLVMYMDGRIEFESLNLKIQEKSNKYLSDVKEDEKMIEDYKKLPEELRDKDTDKAIEELENKIADINKSVDDFMKKVDEAILLKDIETGKKLVKEYSDDMRYDAKEVIAKDSEKLEKLLELGKIAK